MKEIVSIYKKSVDTNLKDISSILKKLDIKNPENLTRLFASGNLNSVVEGVLQQGSLAIE